MLSKNEPSSTALDIQQKGNLVSNFFSLGEQRSGEEGGGQEKSFSIRK